MAGLTNYGNTCYLNSCIQVLRYARPIVTQLLRTKPKDPFLRHFVELLFIDPAEEHLKYVAAHTDRIGLSRFRQCDAHECLLQILDLMHDEGTDMFRGTMTTHVICCECRNVSSSKTPFHTLSLAMAPSVKDALEAFTQPEKVDHTCEACGHGRATKYTTVTPNKVLIVHLKRFTKSRKRTDKIRLTPLNGKKIIASINHTGELGYGHYTAACRKQDGTWIYCNDEVVTPMDGIPESSELPYVLVYA